MGIEACRIEALSPFQKEQVLSIADQCLGHGYVVDLPSTDAASTLVACVDRIPVGFVVSEQVAKDWYTGAKYSRLRLPQDLRDSIPKGGLGVVRTVAVSPAHRGRGIASGLVLGAETFLTSRGAEHFLSLAWTSPAGTHIGGVLQRLGYSVLCRVDDFWTAESIEQGYECPVCGNPCRCSAMAFGKRP